MRPSSRMYSATASYGTLCQRSATLAKMTICKAIADSRRLLMHHSHEAHVALWIMCFDCVGSK